MAFFELAENLARKFRMWGARKINLAGDRDIEWSWVAAHVPQGPGRALDFGCGGGALGLLAVQKGFEVTAVDLEEIRWFYWHPKLKFLREDIFSVKRFGADCFDLVINCSAVEHVGLAGRYGVMDEEPNGDILAMQHLRSLMKFGGKMLLTIPVGRDAVFKPMARVYGEKRLPLLLEGYEILKEEFWLKDSANRWVLTEKNAAVQFKAAMGAPNALKNACALGCFVLQKPQ